MCIDVYGRNLLRVGNLLRAGVHLVRQAAEETGQETTEIRQN